MRRHPEHQAVSAEVRSWYTAPTPEIGMSIVPTAYGFLTDSDRLERRRLILTEDDPAALPAALSAAAGHYGTPSFDVWVDDRARAQRLGPALASAGLEPAQDTVVVALVGPVRAAPGPGGLTLEVVADLAGLEEWVTVKIQGFADTEERPSPSEVAAGVAERQAEWPVCRYLRAHLHGQVAAILGHYTGRDQMVFNLATRTVFRHQGIARHLLALWSQEDHGGPVRSYLLNCDDGGPAHVLYRRLGFTDEVYWHRRYRRTNERGAGSGA